MIYTLANKSFRNIVVTVILTIGIVLSILVSVLNYYAEDKFTWQKFNADAENCNSALKREVEINLHREPKLKMPRAETPAGWIAFGFDSDLNEAMMMALDGMLDLMVEHYVCDRKEALAFASLVVSLRVTQVVNGVRGVHALLPHGLLDGALPKR